MAADKMLSQVLKRITPTEKEKRGEKRLAERIIRQIKETEGRHVGVMLCGSIARDTHLRGDNDLDIFVLFPENLGREEFEKEGLRIGKKVFRGHLWEEAFSEHPYIRGVIDGFDVEIVPSYKVKSAGLLQSAVDRSPFHNAFLQKKLTASHRKEIRLLRQFLKGISAYGADVKSGSVPGYVVELIVLRYGGFMEALKEISKWRQGQAIDIEKYYCGEEAAKKFGGAPLIVVDPVDKNRNVAAALSLNQFSRIVAAAQAFLRKPSKKFFFGKKEKPWNAKKLAKALGEKEIVGISLGYPKNALPDVVWGQILRLARKIEKQLLLNEFSVKRSEAWTDEKNVIVAVFEVENRKLQRTTKKTGPPVTDEKNSMAFLGAHKRLIAGPRIEEGRWVIEVPRKYTAIEKFLCDLLRKEKKVESEMLRMAMNKGCRIMQEKDLAALFRRNREFAAFFTRYLKGEEEFL